MAIRMIISRILFSFFLATFLVTLATEITIADQLTQDEYLAEVRPGPQDQPFPLKIGFVVVDIDSIDGAQQSFVANFAIRITWKDPRLASDLNFVRVIDTDDVWTPTIQILNQQKLFETFPDQVEVAPDGTVTYSQRYWGAISYPMNLKDFPLDDHTLKIKVVAIGKDARNLEFTIDPEITGISDVLTVTDWEVLSWDAVVELIGLGPNLPELPGMVFEFDAKRLVKFYLIKVLIPLMLIVLMSLVVLFIDQNHTGPRLSIAITAILTLIAYRFLLGNLLPKISYLTQMDYFIFGSMFLVFAVLVETSVVARYMSQKREQEASNLDYWSRWIFAVIFVVVSFGSFIV